MALQATTLDVRGDSHKVCSQMRGRPSVAGPQPIVVSGPLRPYHRRAQGLRERLQEAGCRCTFTWQRRDANMMADAVATRAIASRMGGFERAHLGQATARGGDVTWRSESSPRKRSREGATEADDVASTSAACAPPASRPKAELTPEQHARVERNRQAALERRAVRANEDSALAAAAGADAC